MKRKYIVANWKMYPVSLAEARSFRDFIDDINLPDNTDVIVCPPLPYLSIFAGCRHINTGAQDINGHEGGAFTGETSAFIIKEAGARYVIIGHSERRLGCNETNELIQAKVKLAQSNGLVPILCIGEPLEVYRHKQTHNYILKQLTESLPEQYDKNSLIVAYEPIWAIGSGLTPQPEEIEEFANVIKKEYNLPILYGGSVNAGFAREINMIPGLNGVLVGFASTKKEEFKNIINNYL